METLTIGNNKLFFLELKKERTKSKFFVYSVTLPSGDVLTQRSTKHFIAVLVLKIKDTYSLKHWFTRVEKIGKLQSKRTINSKEAYALAFLSGYNPKDTPLQDTGYIKRLPDGTTSSVAGMVGKVVGVKGNYTLIDFKFYQRLALPTRGRGITWEYITEEEYNKFKEKDLQAIRDKANSAVEKVSPVSNKVKREKLAEEVYEKTKTQNETKSVNMNTLKQMKHDMSKLDDPELQAIAVQMEKDISKYNKMSNTGLRRMNTINVLANALIKAGYNTLADYVRDKK